MIKKTPAPTFLILLFKELFFFEAGCKCSVATLTSQTFFVSFFEDFSSKRLLETGDKNNKLFEKSKNFFSFKNLFIF